MVLLYVFQQAQTQIVMQLVPYCYVYVDYLTSSTSTLITADCCMSSRVTSIGSDTKSAPAVARDWPEVKAVRSPALGVYTTRIVPNKKREARRGIA